MAVAHSLHGRPAPLNIPASAAPPPPRAATPPPPAADNQPHTEHLSAEAKAALEQVAPLSLDVQDFFAWPYRPPMGLLQVADMSTPAPHAHLRHQRVRCKPKKLPAWSKMERKPLCQCILITSSVARR